jgi:general secretion pathway protein K
VSHLRPTLQQGAALLLAMLTVTLVAALASAAAWQQWRHVAVEEAERERQQAAWVLTGALDWARLILREDARTNQNTGAGDHLAEPWAVGLEEARLSSFLAADKNTDPPPALEAFLSGGIQDQQGRLNWANLVQQGKLSEPDLRAFTRLYEQLGLPEAELIRVASLWLKATAASQADTTAPPAANTPLLPKRVGQLSWLGVSAPSLQRLGAYTTVLPERTPLNLNTAPAELLVAAVPGLDLARARRAVAQRALTPFKNLADVTAVIGATQEPLNDAQHTTASRYFEVQGSLRLGERVVHERSLVQRNGLQVVTLWRERSAARQPAPGTAAPPSLQ